MLQPGNEVSGIHTHDMCIIVLIWQRLSSPKSRWTWLLKVIDTKWSLSHIKRLNFTPVQGEALKGFKEGHNTIPLFPEICFCCCVEKGLEREVRGHCISTGERRQLHQWCNRKCLTPALRRKKEREKTPIEPVNFHGGNTPTVADFKLPKWSY